MNIFIYLFMALSILYIIMILCNLMIERNHAYDKLIYKYRYNLPVWFVGNGDLMEMSICISMFLPIVNLIMPVFYWYDRYKYIQERFKVAMTDKSTYSIDADDNINIRMCFSDNTSKDMHIFNKDGQLLLKIDYTYDEMTTDPEYVQSIVYNCLNTIFLDYKYLRLTSNTFEMLHKDRRMCDIGIIKDILEMSTLTSQRQ